MTFDRMSDAELIAAVRQGDAAAYGVLYQRHLDAAKRAAACLAGTPAEREDLVADAFTKVLRALRGGGGPHEEFRAYLLVTMRNAAISSARRAVVSLYADVPEVYLPHPGGDPVLTRFDTSAAASAFASLPERWRMVLWHTEVEDETPAEVAKLLGMRPNGVAALAYRAREGLRQAYLRAHLPEVEGRECRATVSKLAGFVRHNVPVPLGRKISRHLAACSDCRARASTLSKVNDELRASLGPLLLGAPFAAAYLPAASTGVVKTVLAKAGAVVAVAAAAATTVASTPPVAMCAPGHTPHLADHAVTGTTITGPPQLPSSRPVGPTPAPAVATTPPPVAPPAMGNSGQMTGSLPAVAETKQAQARARATAARQAGAQPGGNREKGGRGAEASAAKAGNKAPQGKDPKQAGK